VLKSLQFSARGALDWGGSDRKIYPGYGGRGGRGSGRGANGSSLTADLTYQLYHGCSVGYIAVYISNQWWVGINLYITSVLGRYVFYKSSITQWYGT